MSSEERMKKYKEKFASSIPASSTSGSEKPSSVKGRSNKGRKGRGSDESSKASRSNARTIASKRPSGRKSQAQSIKKPQAQPSSGRKKEGKKGLLTALKSLFGKK